MKGNRWRRCFLAFNYLSLAALWTTAFAAEKSPFYQGKTLNIVINFAAGGPTDIESRIFAKHLPTAYSRSPTVTVQAMGGGGGLTAVNYIGEVAKADGFTGGLLYRRSFSASDQRSRAARRYRQIRLYHRRARRHRLLHPRRCSTGHQEALGFRQGAKVSRRRSRREQLQRRSLSLVVRYPRTQIRLRHRLQQQLRRASRRAARRSAISR